MSTIWVLLAFGGHSEQLFFMAEGVEKRGHLGAKPGGLVYALVHSWPTMSLPHVPAAL